MLRLFWSSFFGGVIGSRRKARGLSLGDAARLAGMALSEWMAIEDGCVPEDPERLRVVADTLELDRDRLFRMAAFCRRGGGA